MTVAPLWTELATLTPENGGLERAAEIIQTASPNHTGVYLYGLEGDTLVLRAHRGRPTEHERIAVGAGVCGRAVASGSDQLVDDVTADPDYIACSLETRAEIVVLVHWQGRIVGQIDIDSDARAAFSEEDLASLRSAAELIAPLFVGA